MADSVLVLRAIRGNAKSLNLNGKKLKQVPVSLEKLTSLLSLQLKNNNIATLPVEMKALNNLTELNIGNNILEEVPEVLKELKALKKLHLFGNRIQEIHPSLYGKLSNLEFLGLRNNKIENIPVELCSLSKLSELHLTSNKLTTIPQELRLLTNLTQLHLARNQISELPEVGTWVFLLSTRTRCFRSFMCFIYCKFNELMLEELYCEDNPFLQKEPVESIQQEEVLSLKEIAARFVMKELRNRQSCIRDLIAQYPLVKSLLSQGGRCALCGQGFLNIWLECVKFENLKKVFCWSTFLQSSDLGQKEQAHLLDTDQQK
uniref:Leucine-rich repeat-containing protein 69 n=1 Tax=Erpetoichthys calabaricus TaxID=27687 RepID=A0A8C4TGI3_ERPCA